MGELASVIIETAKIFAKDLISQAAEVMIFAPLPHAEADWGENDDMEQDEEPSSAATEEGQHEVKEEQATKTELTKG